MKEKLKCFYRTHSGNFFLRTMLHIGRACKHFLQDTKAAATLVRWKCRTGKPGSIIRVCFLQQDANCWNKSKALYEQLCKDSRFQVSLLCVPDPFDTDTSGTYRFFAENGYDAIDARVGNGPWDTRSSQGEWFDLSSLQPDYVFYQQPYDAYLPQCYRSKQVSRYTRICITLYGIILTRQILNCMEKEFYRHVYRSYAISDAERAFNRSRFPISHFLGLRTTQYFGPLPIVDFLKQKQSTSPSWEFSQNQFRVIWTPRWTTDETLGGSNFFRYKDFLPEYAASHPNTDILMRPHPMAFDNFVQTGKMTQAEVDSYILQCNSAANTAIDNQKKYDATFWQSSVLLTDLSAIIIEYFITGKPIIFCQTENPSSTFLDFFQQILQVCYIANNQDDIARYLQHLKAGHDPLQSARLQVIKKLFGADPLQIPEMIAHDIAKDYGI